MSLTQEYLQCPHWGFSSTKKALSRIVSELFTSLPYSLCFKGQGKQFAPCVFVSAVWKMSRTIFFFFHQTVSKLLFVSYVSMLIVAMSAFDPVVRARTGGLLPPINVPVEYEMDFKQFSTTCCSHFDIMRPRWDEANECHRPQMFTLCFLFRVGWN